MSTIARVFPCRTAATPTDDLAFVGNPGLFVPEVDAVHVSCVFTWQLPEAERLAKAWARVAPVSIGGPATGQRSDEFVPGRYVREGYVITSRGCPNRCAFCEVPRREGPVRELPIAAGWNVLDDNLLACSDRHVENVFAMLKRQKGSGHRIEFTGGLEAARLQPWHVTALRELRPKQLFMAYDTHDDLEPLRDAGRMLLGAGFTTTSRALRCYVLCGYHGDTTDAALKRMHETLDAGFWPMAMPFRGRDGRVSEEWKRFARPWVRPAIMGAQVRQLATPASRPAASPPPPAPLGERDGTPAA